MFLNTATKLEDFIQNISKVKRLLDVLNQHPKRCFAND